MRLELQDAKGLTGVFIELPLDQLRAEIGLVSSSVAEPKATEALKVEVQSFEAQLEESQGKVAELKEKLAKGAGKTMDDFSQLEKATFVIAWGKGLSPENKAIFAEQVMEIPIAKATEAAVAEKEPKAKVEENPNIIKGRTDKPGYRYLELVDYSIKE